MQAGYSASFSCASFSFCGFFGVLSTCAQQQPHVMHAAGVRTERRRRRPGTGSTRCARKTHTRESNPPVGLDYTEFNLERCSSRTLADPRQHHLTARVPHPPEHHVSVFLATERSAMYHSSTRPHRKAPAWLKVVARLVSMVAYRHQKFVGRIQHIFVVRHAEF